jgi:hypothetical protein
MDNTSLFGGAIMHADEMSNLVATKVAEMEAKLAELIADPKLSDATKRTQKFQRNTMIHIYKLFETVLNQSSTDDFTFTEEEAKWFKSMTALSEEREITIIKVQKGDTFMGIIQKYPKATLERIQKACKKAGLSLNMATGIVE